MEITYRRKGDYFLPELTVSVEQPNIGKYGRLRKKYLQEQKKATYTLLLLTGTLMEHLADMEKDAQNMLEHLTKEMERQQGVTEALKASDQLQWVALKNNIRQAAEEIVLHDLIYC